MINRRLINLVGDSKVWIFLTVLMKWISLLFNIINIMFIANYLEFTYLYGVDSRKGLITLGIFIISILIRAICNYMSVKFSSKCSQNARITLRNTIYEKLINLGINYNEKVSTSETIQVAIDGVEQLEIYFGRYLPQFFYSVLAPLTLFVTLGFISIKVVLILLICVPLIPISIALIMKIAKKIFAKYWGIYVNLGDTFLENLQGLTTLKIYNMDEDRNTKMNEEAENFRKITMKVLSMQLNSISVMDLIAFGGSAIGMILTLKELAQGRISMAGAFTIILLSSEFFIPLRLLGSFFHVAMNGISASQKIFNIIDTPLEQYKTKEIKDFNSLSVEFKNVNFSYEEDRKILNSINLNINSGKITALVGPSGCGKSTISSLIMGFNKNYQGKILINGNELREIDEEQLKRKINIVTHNSYIFTGTIEENLKMGRESASIEEMYEALRKVNLYDFVMSLDNKLKSEIKEGGANLSGGQRQRLALARALLYDSEIYIFDEATSNIDVESENEIMDVIYEIGKEKTILLISHRLYNVKNADCIYVLSQGEIKECGNHKELMNKKGIYFTLVEEQNELEKLGADYCA
ncbi:ABC transporter ATP-binding protein/permease [Clostridium tetani]|uniref:Multidrug resistance protein 1 n=1 Tax=Clostridium tetani (strain Massachusetts / E88) TaxID=212717 RepID=Q895S1_CLOTE|nr:ABC transporter ATP-binding protein/permease [Clostridium tetani]AAO35769.1 multidrug resistance protein 1 [Clostridium tetani E88]KGI38339.1 cysteine ABC transporter ATP-binding protein [Clostridium tetani]KGI40213.1 cysteine ABC transporter ATP-binding protein [Clostridium tetani ATCC 9441]KGI42787.1 cysteine ABC transporter ATP-binding protein [Clostridium tetani]KHO33281.1 cysteine ABC transporter ATP-binding protein [Clostridium tetani]